jgi:regulatory protein
MARAGEGGTDEREGAPSLIGRRVTALTPLRGKSGLVSVRVGSRTLGAVEAGAASDAGVRVGAEVTAEMVSRVRRAAALARAKAAALRRLERRGKSSNQLVDDLVRAGHEKDAAVEAVERLRLAGLIDDRALAESYARRVMTRSASGRRLVEAKLRGKRFGGEVAAEAAKAAAGERDALEDAVALARKKVRAMPRSIEPAAVKRRVWAALARRGFEADVCRRAVERVMGKGSDGAA